MAKLATITLIGASGAKYDFDVYKGDTIWKVGVQCVYYISKRNQKSDNTYSHTAIYIGATDDLKERLENHHKQPCFDRHGYNAISVHPETSSTKRLAIETDLIEAKNPPCND